MNIISIKQIEDYVRKNDYVLLFFTAIGKNYVSICLKHKTGNRKNKPDKPLIGRIYEQESLKALYNIYQIIKSMRFRYLNDFKTRYKCYYLFIEGLEPQLGLSGLNCKFFDEVVERYKKQYEIIKNIFQ